MRKLLRAWTAFWFAPLDPLPAGLFRICLGTLITIAFACAYPSWDRFYGADGMLSLYDPTVNSPVQGWWTLFWWTEEIVPVRAYWWLGTAAAVSFTLGWHTRVATVVLFSVVASMVHRNPMVVNGEDLVFRMLLFYSCFAPLGISLSLDAAHHRRSGMRRRSRRSAGRRAAAAWPVRAMQINVLLIYVFSQPYKLVEDEVWVRGEAMYYTMINGTWSRWPWPELFYDPWVSAVATYGSLALELAFPVLVWIPPLRLPALLAMGALHVGIAVVLANVTLFSLAMPCALLLFLRTEDIRKLLALVGREALLEGVRPATAASVDVVSPWPPRTTGPAHVAENTWNE